MEAKNIRGILKGLPGKTKNHLGIYDFLLILVTVLIHTVFYPIVQKYNPIGIPFVSSLDGLIPFVPVFIIPYLLFVPFLCLSVFLVRKNVRVRHGLLTSFTISSVIGILIYLFYQTSVIRPDIAPVGVLNLLIEGLYLRDAPLNAFPSFHVALTTCAIFFLRNKWKLMTLFGLLIISSTVFIKQHYLWDVAGGLVLAIIAIIISIYVSHKINPEEKVIDY